MKFVLDTNIIILMIKNDKFNTYFQETYLNDASKTFCLSIVSLGEITAVAAQNKWGKQKLRELHLILKGLNIIQLDNRKYVKAYAKIDTFSQGKLDGQPLPNGLTARNMGKNDLWIAAVTEVLEATLITTDKDFNHLDPALITIDYIDIELFK